MDLSVLALVLLTAAVHAGWNGWLKKASPDFIGLAAISVGWLIVGAVAVFFVGWPAPVSWPYLLSTTIVHMFYTGLLVGAYRHGELSLTYPIARGTGPLLVALAAPFFLNERLDPPDLLAVGLIVPGIMVIGLAGGRADLHNRHAILLSLATGFTIALYTLIDAAGARSGPSPHTYSAWLFVLAASALLLAAFVIYRGATITLLTPHLRRGAPVGIISALAYMVVLWAMTVAPVALVAAIRETSIFFAALIGWWFLGEKITGLRWLGVVLTVIGLVIARL